MKPPLIIALSEFVPIFHRYLRSAAGAIPRPRYAREPRLDGWSVVDVDPVYRFMLFVRESQSPMALRAEKKTAYGSLDSM